MCGSSRDSKEQSAEQGLAERLASLRSEFGDSDGTAILAERLGISVDQWKSYECGQPVPGELLIKVVEVTSAELLWLISGAGKKYRPPLRDD
jgi:transcriptional regulator with XRE-family HTH domain